MPLLSGCKMSEMPCLRVSAASSCTARFSHHDLPSRLLKLGWRLVMITHIFRDRSKGIFGSSMDCLKQKPQWLRAHIALLEGECLCQYPTTTTQHPYQRAHNQLSCQLQGIQHPFLDSMVPAVTHRHRHKQLHIHK